MRNITIQAACTGAGAAKCERVDATIRDIRDEGEQAPVRRAAQVRAGLRNSYAFSPAPGLAQLPPAMAPRTHRRLAAVFAVSPLVLAALACTPKPATPDGSGEEPAPPSEILGRTVPDASGPLVFPPGPEGRRQRPALEIGATDETDPNTGFRVQSPRLEDGKDSFEVEGQRVRIVFNRPVKLAKPLGKKPQPAAANVLTLEPADVATRGIKYSCWDLRDAEKTEARS